MIIIAILAVLVLWGISVQNSLVKSDELCKNALRQINVQQMSRYDALKALIKLTREYASYEADTLQKVIEERKVTSSPNPTAAEINANQASLDSIAARLIAVSERYPDLKANENYQKTMDSIQLEYREVCRGITVTKFNNQVRMFPGSIVAGILGFAQRDYLAEDKTKTEYPEI